MPKLIPVSVFAKQNNVTPTYVELLCRQSKLNHSVVPAGEKVRYFILLGARTRKWLERKTDGRWESKKRRTT